MNVACIFSGAPYDLPTGRIVSELPHLGVDKVLVFDDLWITEQPFYRINKYFWDHPGQRGAGWYCWKSYIVIEAMNRCSQGDVVFYLDADSVPTGKHFGPLFNQCRYAGGILLFRANPHRNRHYVKRDTAVVMAMDEPQYWDESLDAGVARFAFFEKGPWLPQQFLCEWLAYSLNKLANTFDPSILRPEYDWLIEPRCEQAVLSLLAHKYGIPLHPELDYEQGYTDQQNPRPVETRQTTAPIKGSRWRNV